MLPVVVVREAIQEVARADLEARFQAAVHPAANLQLDLHPQGEARARRTIKAIQKRNNREENFAFVLFPYPRFSKTRICRNGAGSPWSSHRIGDFAPNFTNSRGARPYFT